MDTPADTPTDVAVRAYLRDVPRRVWFELCDWIKNYTVPVVGLRGDSKISSLGSGTLVTDDSDFYILTAAHVWDRRVGDLERSDAVAVPLLEDRRQDFRIQTEHLVPIPVGEYAPRGE